MLCDGNLTSISVDFNVDFWFPVVFHFLCRSSCLCSLSFNCLWLPWMYASTLKCLFQFWCSPGFNSLSLSFCFCALSLAGLVVVVVVVAVSSSGSSSISGRNSSCSSSSSSCSSCIAGWSSGCGCSNN